MGNWDGCIDTPVGFVATLKKRLAASPDDDPTQIGYVPVVNHDFEESSSVKICIVGGLPRASRS